MKKKPRGKQRGASLANKTPGDGWRFDQNREKLLAVLDAQEWRSTGSLRLNAGIGARAAERHLNDLLFQGVVRRRRRAVGDGGGVMEWRLS